MKVFLYLILVILATCSPQKASKFLGIIPFAVSTSTSTSTQTLNLVSISISPGDSVLTLGTAQKFTITGNYGTSTSDISSQVTWTSSNVNVASVDSTGNVSPLSAGTTITQASIQSLTAQSIITVQTNVAPILQSASSYDATTIRLIFNKNIDTTSGTVISNYKIVNSVSGSCSDNSNFTSSTQTSDFSLLSVSGSGTTFDIKLSSSQIVNSNYYVVLNKSALKDNSGTLLSCPNNGNFIGLEKIKILSASCLSTTSVILNFSKPVKTGINSTGSAECNSSSECANRFKFLGASSLGSITGASVLDGKSCNGLSANSSSVCITNSTAQLGGIYTVIAANAIDGDNFDNSSWAAIRNQSDTENLQSSPNDRYSFTGCGTNPTDFTSGPVSSDPFSDLTAFGYLMTYGGQIYIGPSSYGNSATRFNPDLTNPQIVSFQFAKDVTGSRTSSNSASSRDGGITVPPYVGIGFSGCNSNSGNLLTGCGPDNENGRGLFVNGTINGTDYLFITGARTTRNYYMYYTSDLGNTLSYNYLDGSRNFTTCGNVTQNQVTESIVIFNNKIYWSQPGDGSSRPYVSKVGILKQEYSNCTSDGDYLNFHWMTGIGQASALGQNGADFVGGILYGFNDRLYFFNSGSISSTCSTYSAYVSGTCLQTGGFVRSINNDPTACTSADTCADWVDHTPTDVRFQKFFSIGLASLSDLIPSQKPIPVVTSFNGNLFLIRNACLNARWNNSCAYNTQCSDDPICPSGSEVPQLWKCIPGANNTCESGEWSLVAENGSIGYTNFGDSNNSKLSLLQVNGSYLYVGFDNTNGVQVWRTNSMNPSSVSDFTQIGTSGLGSSSNTQIYSSTSAGSNPSYIYISVGKNSQPVSIYRQQNN